MDHPFISVVIPTRNAEETIESCLKSLRQMDYPIERLEIIIADGVSTDRTGEIAEAYEVAVVPNPGLRVVSGRNVGFEAAQGELVAFSDADCVMETGWLKNCVKYFQDEQVAAVGGPNLVPDDESSFAKAVGIIFDCASSVGGGAPTRILKRPIESRSHGSNAIYRAGVLRRVMPVDEDMTEGEDVVMNARIKSLGYKLLYVPDVIVFHYRRATPGKWWSQMYRYGLGKALMMKKMRGTVTSPQIGLGLMLPLLAAFVVLSGIFYPLLLAIGVGVGIGVGITAFTFSYFKTRSVAVGFSMVLALLILPLAWSCGFWRELALPTKKPEVSQ